MHLVDVASVIQRCLGSTGGRRLRLGMIGLLLTGSIARTAPAQSEGETEVARERFKAGVQHYDQREYDKARLAFLQAYLLRPHPAVLLNLAQSELRAGRYADAATNLAKYIRENPGATAIEHAKASFEEARQKVAELNVEVNAPGAAVLVDGSDVARSPVPNALYLMPGRHVVAARKGSGGADQTLDVIAGQRVYVRLELQENYGGAAPAAPAPSVTPDAALVLRADPAAQPAEAAVDGGGGSKGFFAWIADTPPAIATVSVAGLALGTSAVLAGFASNRYAAASNARSQIMEALRENVESGVLVGTATPCGRDGIANRTDVFDSRVAPRDVQYLSGAFAYACDRFTERSESGDRLKTLSLVSLGVGAFATIGTVIWYFSDRDTDEGTAGAADPRRDAKATLIPVVSGDTQGLWLNVSF